MANPFFVQSPQYGQGLQSLAQGVQQFGQQRKEEQRLQEAEDYKQRAKQAMAQAFQSGDPMAIRQAVIEYPEIAETATQMFGFTNDQTEKVARETYRRALSETDPTRRQAIMEGGIETVRQFGGNPRNMASDLQMLRDNPEGFERSARAGYAALASEQEFEAMFPDTGAGEPAGVRQFRSMVEAAGLQPGTEEYQQAALVSLGLEPRAGISASERIANDPELQSRVADLERRLSGEKRAGSQAIEQSEKAFERLQTVKSSLPKYDRAIELVDQGANTGALASRFPSLTAETVELENLQRQLGLDVISAVTFGALSEKEMEVAMQTALPTTLEGPELKEWLRTKKRSQEKLADYLAEAAQFLGTPGNTVADWMAKAEGNGEGQDTEVNWSDL